MFDVRPYGDRFGAEITKALFKSESLEAIRLVLPKGKKIPPHHTRGDVTVQCLEGHVLFTEEQTVRELRPGDLIYVPPGCSHALEALENTSLLVTIAFKK